MQEQFRDFIENAETFVLEVIFEQRRGKLANFTRACLFALSKVFELLVKFRRFLYNVRILRDSTLGVQVIAIGNLTVGGTGKTPVVEKFARVLQDEGRQVAILSRGYRSKPPPISTRLINKLLFRDDRTPPRIVSDGKSLLLDSETAGDEPFMLASNLRDVVVLVDKDRVKAGRYAIEKFGCDILLLDDGFQYWKILGRRRDIVLIDYQQPFGNEHLLHYRTDAVTDLRVALGTADAPICRELGENETQCARILLLIVAPRKFATEYLQLVGAFARLLSKQPVVDELLAQPDAGAFANLPILRDYELPAKLTVRDIMTYQPRTIDPDTVLKEAAREMVRLGVGGLPVVDKEGLVVGMLGERELLRSLSGYLQGGRGEGQKAPGVPNSKPTVRDAMTRQVLCVSPDEAIADVSSMMTNKDVDRVPVVRDGRIVGMLTRGDIVRKLLGH